MVSIVTESASPARGAVGCFPNLGQRCPAWKGKLLAQAEMLWFARFQTSFAARVWDSWAVCARR